MTSKRIVFMGTPDFAAVSLQSLYKACFNVVAVFCQPDKPKNRGMKIAACPVKEMAISHGTPVFQPATLKDGEALRILCELKPDVIVAVAYGKLLPEDILSLPPYGCINIHGSLLPKYRGSAPVQWTVLNGDAEAGVTAMFMAKEMDAGDILGKVSVQVLPEETAGMLFERLAPIGGELLCKTLSLLFEGKLSPVPQDNTKVSFAPPLSKELSPIDWNTDMVRILCRIRGLNPWPVATMEINGTVFKVFEAKAETVQHKTQPGTVLAADKNGILISCLDGAVRVTELQAPGGKRMKASDYLRGHPICL